MAEIDTIVERLANGVIEQWGIHPGYVPRITNLIADFQQFDFVLDGGWHTLDLSAIVPAGATAVNLAIRVIPVGVGDDVRFRCPPDTRNPGRSILFTQFVGVNKRQVWTQGIDENRHVDYRFADVGWNSIILLVRGWWL